jgi:hypothetical protein
MVPGFLMPFSAAMRAYLVAAFLLFNVFAFARAAPINTNLPENDAQARGDNDRDIERVFQMAQLAAALPFWQVRNHAIYLDRNPALFMFVAELGVRMGATTPLPLQVLGIVLWNVGLVFCFAWLRRCFGSDVAGAAGIGFLLTTPCLLFFSASIHHEPYCFCFFQLAMYCFVRFLEGTDARRWLIATCAAYFLLCQNYWFYYVSAYLMFVALQLKYGKFSVRTSAVLAAVPVVALVTVILQVGYARGGLGSGLFRMADILAARTGDFRIHGSQWHAGQKFVGQKQLHEYPLTVMRRLGATMGYPAPVLFGMFFLGPALAGREAWARYRWLLVVLAAGLSWYVLMVQHTVLHNFVGMYSHFLWTVAAAVLGVEVERRAASWPRWTVIALIGAVAAVGLSRNYVPYLTRYVRNIAAGKVVDSGRSPSKSKKSKKKNKKDKKKPRDKAST